MTLEIAKEKLAQDLIDALVQSNDRTLSYHIFWEKCPFHSKMCYFEVLFFIYLFDVLFLFLFKLIFGSQHAMSFLIWADYVMLVQYA